MVRNILYIQELTSFIPPPLIAVPVPVILAFAICYRILAPYFSTSKKQSYLLSVFTSGMMSIVSVRYVAALWQGGFAGVIEEDKVGAVAGMAGMARWATAFFTGYLAADLIVGYVYYRDQIGFLTGWVHHIIYIAVTSYLQFTPWCGLFALAAAMEIPTFHLGLSALSPQVFRHDATFLVLFFLTRILFHTYLIVALLLPSSLSGLGGIQIDSARNAIGGSIVPGVLTLGAMPLHAMWFLGGVKGYIKRRKAKRAQRLAAEIRIAIERELMQAAANQTTKMPTEKDIEVLLSPTSQFIEPHSQTSVRVDADAGFAKKWSSYLPATPSLVATPLTPPETPLLTPSSSMAQAGLGTGYFFQHINDSLSNIPNLSQLHLPAALLNLRDSFGAKLPQDEEYATWIPGRKRQRIMQNSHKLGDGNDEDRHRFADALLARMPSMQSVRRRLTLKRKLSETETERELVEAR